MNIIQSLAKVLLLSIIFLSCNQNTIPQRSSKYKARSMDAAWRIGIALYSFHTSSFVESIEKSDSAGVDFVEGFSFHMLGTEFNNAHMGTVSQEGRARMRQVIDKHVIRMPSMFMGANTIDQWKSYFEMAKEFDMEYLVSEPRKDQLDMVDSLAGIYKIKVAIHQHSKAHGSIYWHPDSVFNAIKGRPNLRACADLGHWARSGLNPIDGLKRLQGQILGIHFLNVESFTPTAKGVPGKTGVINLSGVITELKNQKFNGMIYIECVDAPFETLNYLRELTTKKE